jgi:hypothetical protein
LKTCFGFPGTIAVVTPIIPTATTNPTCSSNLCSNRGSCQQVSYGTGIQCYCLTGWTGSRCQYSKFTFSKLSVIHKFISSLAMRSKNGLDQDSAENNRTILTNVRTHIRRQRT